MDPNRNYYSILEIPASATQEQIKQAYRTLLQVWHPDRFHHNANLLRKAEQKAKEVNAAFETLSNPTLRRQYDEILEKDRKQSATQAHADSENNESLTTRCPNPKCDLSLRVQSRSVGKVTCPTCRTSFLYDPVRKEKWHVQHSRDEAAAAGGAAEDNQAPSQETRAAQEESIGKGAAIFVPLAVVLLGAVVWGITTSREKSVMLDMPRPGKPSVPVETHAPATHSVNRDDGIDAQVRPPQVEDGYFGFRLEDGDDLIKPILFPGEGELTVVNDTAWDATFKLYDGEMNGGTLYRYWFIRSGHRVTLKELGPCNCSLYFALGTHWDPDRRGFIEESRYWKYDEPFVYRVPRAANNGEWERYLIRVVESPMGVESASSVAEETFNDLF